MDPARSSFSPIDSQVASPFRDVESRPNSPSPTSVAGSDNAAGTLGGTPVKTVSAATDPNTQLKLDIRAHSVAVKETHDQAMKQQGSDLSKAKQAKQTWQTTPLYHFGDRLKHYNASARAQIKFNMSTSLVGLEKMHVAYLETLSKSDLPPEEQHAAYTKFKEALTDAQQKRRYADNEESLSVGCSSKMKEFFAPQVAAAKTAATKAQQKVQQLLNEIQHPHTALSHNVAQVLEYRKQQLRQTPATSPEVSKLKAEITEINSFVASGGLNGLRSQEAANLNKLVTVAAGEYKTFRAESAKLNATSLFRRTAPAPSEAEKAFKTADAAVMTEIRRLKSQGPPELRKELTSHLKHKEFSKASAGETSTPRLDDDIATLRSFLASPRFANLDSKSQQSQDLSRLIQESNQKYATFQELENVATRLEVEADKAAKEAEAKTAAAMTTATSSSAASAPATAAPSATTAAAAPAGAAAAAKTPEQEATEKAAQEAIQIAKETARNAAQAAAQKATTAAKEARARANTAKIAMEEADADVISEIRLLDPPKVLYATPSQVVIEAGDNESKGISSPTLRYDIVSSISSVPPEPDLASTPPLKDSTGTAATNAVTASPPASPEENARLLWKFAERLQTREDSDFSRAQIATLGKFVALNEEAIAALPPEKLKGLVDRMKEIEEKNKLIAAPSEQELIGIEEEKDDLETQFIAALEK